MGISFVVFAALAYFSGFTPADIGTTNKITNFVGWFGALLVVSCIFDFLLFTLLGVGGGLFGRKQK